VKNAIIAKPVFINFIVPFIVLAMLTACSSLTALNGRQRVFEASYETVTNKLWALSPSQACIDFTNAAWAASKQSASPETVVHTTNPPLVERFVFGRTTNAPLSGALERRPIPRDFWFSGRELVPGQSYEFGILEEPLETIWNTATSILVTRIDSKSTRVRIKTIDYGFYFNSRDGKIEKQRLNELSQLLSKKK
jgi:hypothetical protein